MGILTGSAAARERLALAYNRQDITEQARQQMKVALESLASKATPRADAASLPGGRAGGRRVASPRSTVALGAHRRSWLRAFHEESSW